ncbi:MAG: DnaA regulatory inactivator Hda [Alcanivoracaceae bacterium]|nr:DnaA regulatory inactivator Hda [Alcanivoracaceae bacterium]
MTPSAQLPLPLQLRDASSFASWEAGDNQPIVDGLRGLARARKGQLFLWGQPGSGRSHLLEAVVREALDRQEQVSMLAGTELPDLPPSLLEGLEHADWLVIDDLDQVAGLADWEEGLFHLYNRCLSAGVAMVFAASGPPAELGVRLPDLASRLAAGPVYRIQPLADADLENLLVRRARGRGLEVGADVARFVVARCGRSPAALMACLANLDRAALASQRRLTIPFVKQASGW